jgi:prepilin-type N-terminal cleavage/methylation domain-containing protein
MEISGAMCRSVSYIQRGFSLIELSVSLAITGILIAGGLLVSTILLEESALHESRTRLRALDNALRAYVQVQGRLPCPASRTLAVGDPGYALEQATAPGSCSSGGATGVVSSAGVYIGAIPVRSMGIPDSYLADAYGNRFIYAVTESLTDATQFTQQAADLSDTYSGAVHILDQAGNAITNEAAYVLVSVGTNGLGGYRYKSGVLRGACATTQPDGENCNDDHIFRDRRLNDGSQAANYFDDLIHYSPKFILTHLALNSSENLCNADNDGLLRYDEDAELFYKCTYSITTGSRWQQLPVIDQTTVAPAPCHAHQKNLIRLSPDPLRVGEYDYCREINPTTFEWTAT